MLYNALRKKFGANYNSALADRVNWAFETQLT